MGVCSHSPTHSLILTTAGSRAIRRCDQGEFQPRAVETGATR